MSEITISLLATLASVIALGNLLGRFFRRLGQPPVIGEVFAGILLGPSFLGAISPTALHLLIPESEELRQHTLTALKAIAELGIVLYMFLVGLELNSAQLRRQARAAFFISNAGIIVCFLLGLALAYGFRSRLSSPDTSFIRFALFMGVAMSITAFPVLARILSDQKMEKTKLGILALGCAASGDVTAWCLLALAVGVAQGQVNSALGVFLGAAIFIAVMLAAVKPLASRWAERFESRPVSAATLSLLMMAILVAALATEAIGIHAVFGAFLLGVILPHDSRLAREFHAKVHDATTILLLPAFFALTGMNMQIALLNSWQDWSMCAAILIVACAGKFGGTLFAARLTGQDWKTSAALGALMNTRGLMELIVLNIGLQLGVISPRLYAMMVLMALITTLTASPVLNWFKKKDSTPSESNSYRADSPPLVAV